MCCALSVPCVSKSAEPAKRLRAGGYAGLKRVMKWNLDFMGKSDEGKAYLDVAKRVDEAIQARTRWCIQLPYLRKGTEAAAPGCTPAYYATPESPSAACDACAAGLRLAGTCLKEAVVPHVSGFPTPVPIQT